jgi:hypothetical protein
MYYIASFLHFLDEDGIIFVLSLHFCINTQGQLSVSPFHVVLHNDTLPFEVPN